MTVNKAILVGNLGRDPEVRFTPSGRAVANFTLATTERWTDPDGNKKEHTEWHTIVVWGKQAETCGQYLSKGRQVYVEGKIRSREYEDKEGHKRKVTEVIADNVRFLGGGGGGGRQASTESFNAPMGQEPAGGGAGGDDDIPF
jgi:single-strand DNA-binding protein